MEQICLCTTSTDLAIQAGQHTKAIELPPQYKEFTKVFSEKKSFHFPPQPWNHMIEFKKGTPDMIDCKVYPMSQSKDKALQEFLTEQLKKGYICPSESQYSSSFFITKKDGKLCPVQDYRRINNYSILYRINTHFPSSHWMKIMLLLLTAPWHIYNKRQSNFLWFVCDKI